MTPDRQLRRDIMHAEFKTQTRTTNILRFLRNMRKIYYGFKLEAYFSQCILNLCPNVRLGVTSALTFLSLEHKRWVFIPLFMELRVDGLYSRGAAIGRRSISGILLALAPLVPGCLGACIWKMKAKHHKKLPGRLHRPRIRRAVDLASYNGQPQTLLHCVTGTQLRF